MSAIQIDWNRGDGRFRKFVEAKDDEGKLRQVGQELEQSIRTFLVGSDVLLPSTITQSYPCRTSGKRNCP